MSRNTPATFSIPPVPVSSSLLVFPLPGLLSARHRLLLDPAAHLALFCSWQGDDTFLPCRSFALTPSATRVFVSLLQAYPLPCSYFTLFVALYPRAAQQEAWKWDQEREIMLPPVRRALKSLLPTLRACGLQAVSLRGRGYVLASASATASHESSPAWPGTSDQPSPIEHTNRPLWEQQVMVRIIPHLHHVPPMIAVEQIRLDEGMSPRVTRHEVSLPELRETGAQRETVPPVRCSADQ